MDIEFIKKETLEKTYKNVIYDYDKEHVTPYIYKVISSKKLFK